MSGEWSNGLFGCFSNCGVCIISWLVPCYTVGKVAESVGDNCLLCGLVFFVPLANLFFGAQIRGKVREQKGIDGGFITDLLAFWCCTCCTIIQMANETNAMGQAQSMDRE